MLRSPSRLTSQAYPYHATRSHCRARPPPAPAHPRDGRRDGHDDPAVQADAEPIFAAASMIMATTSRATTTFWSLTKPDVVRDVHDAYLEAGADIIETNTFNATAHRAGRLRHARARSYEINRAAARIAREAADAWTARTPDKPRFVAGAIGPDQPHRVDLARRQRPGRAQRDVRRAGGRVPRGGRRASSKAAPTSLLVETVFDTLNAKAALFAVESFFETAGRRLPVIVSGTITDASGRTLSGQTPEAFWNSVRHVRPLAVGLNCALGRGADAALHRGDRARRRHVRLLLSERRPAQPDGGDGLRRNAGSRPRRSSRTSRRAAS